MVAHCLLVPRQFQTRLLTLDGAGVCRETLDATAPPTLVGADPAQKTGNSYANAGVATRIDHVLMVDELYDGDATTWDFSDLDVVNGHVDQRPYGEELSDHYGVSVSLVPRAFGADESDISVAD